jgi:lipoprotein NlpI
MFQTKQQTQKNMTKSAKNAGNLIENNSIRTQYMSINSSPFSVLSTGLLLLAVTILGNAVVFAQQAGNGAIQPNPIRNEITTQPMTQPMTQPATTPAAPATNTEMPITPTNTEEVVTDPVVKAELDKAVTAFKESKFADAHNILKTLYEGHAEIMPPRIVMANMFAQAKLGDAVLVNLELATEETKDDPEAYLLLGEIALKQRHLTAAELLLKDASEKIEHYSANPVRRKNLTNSLYRVLTDLYETRQRWTQMEQCIDSQIKFDGQNANLLRRKGIAVFRQNRDDEAKQLLLQADQLDNTKEPAQKGLPADAIMSQLYLTRGDKDNARKALEAALAVYPKSKEILALSVRMKISDDNLNEAIPLAQQLLEADPTSAAAKRLRATVALYAQEYELAERLFQELLLESPTDTQAQNGLALALCEQNSQDKKKRALEYAADNVRKHQSNSEFWGTLGWVQFNVNALEDAAKSLQQSVASGSMNADTAYYLAQLHAKSNRNDDAKQLLELALKNNNQFPKRREASRLLRDLSQK